MRNSALNFNSLCLLFVFLVSFSTKTYSQNYWQQEVNYHIEVRLDDKKHSLTAFETIHYKNNSDQVLNEIYFHLWPNAYKDQNTAFAKQQLRDRNLKFIQASENERGYIDSLDFKVEGIKIDWEYDAEHKDICKLILNTPLQPGQEIVITTPFYVKLPNSFSRLGHVGQSYQITQWYPKPAVFDRKGWHRMPYLDLGEFYSEFGSFDVYITLPENYVVGATGDLQTYSEQLFLDSIAEHTAKIESFPKKDSLIESSEKYKTLHYKQSMVHDFAWFADKNFNVLKSEVILPHTKRKVDTYVMFRNRYAKFWKDASEYMNDALYYYSLWNGDYPYNQATAVDGALSAGGGMEYPNVTVIGTVNSPRSLETVIMHEVGHNWFYGIIGSNEREHPWMDEGINTYFERRYLRTKYPNSSLFGDSVNENLLKHFDLQTYNTDAMYDIMYQYIARLNEDQAIENHSESFGAMNYGLIVYGKSGLVLRYLEQYLGTSVFDSAMKVYFERWKFRHPYPEDFRAVMEEVSQKDLSWFFDHLIGTNDKIDFKLTGMDVVNGQMRVKVKNKSNFLAPAFVASIDKQGNVKEIFKTDPFMGTALVFFDTKDIDHISIDPYNIIPEVSRKNNRLNVEGLFGSIEPFDLQLLGSLENRNKTQLFFSPIIGYNYYDKGMPGFLFYNHLFPTERFEWELAPMYSFANDQFNWTGRLAYDLYPDNLKLLTLSTRFSHFSQAYPFAPQNQLEVDVLANGGDVYSDYYKLGFYADLILNTKANKFSVVEGINMQLTGIRSEGRMKYIGMTMGMIQTNLVAQIAYSKSNNRIRNPYSLKVMGESFSAAFMPNSTNKFSVEYKYVASYGNQSKGVELRGYAGYSSGNQGAVFLDGIGADYRYDYAHLDRSGNNVNHFYVLEGGFKSKMSMPVSKSMLALNLKLPMPVKFPLGLYGDIAYVNAPLAKYKEQVVMGVGLYVPVIRNIAEIYFPLSLKKDRITENIYSKSNYTQEIRLMINFNAMNPFNAIRNLGIN